jgi:multiple sugar transport system ATP-binding protein
MNFLDATLTRAGADGATVTLSGGVEVRAAVDATGAGDDAPITLGIRPEHIVLADSVTGDADLARIPVDVALVEHLGEGTLVYVKLPGMSELIVCRTEGTTRVKEGQKIELGLPAGECHLFAGHEARIDEDSSVENLEVEQMHRKAFRRLVEIEV